jgi:hypothetical protein
MPAGFTYPNECEIWAPVPLNPAKEARFNRYVFVVTRLKSGVPLSQAQAEMDTISQRLAQTYVQTNAGWGVRLIELRESLVGELRTSLLILLGAVAVTRYMTTLLFGVKPIDTSTFVAVGVVLALVVLVACLVPARRAAKIDPLEALR